MDRSLQVAIEAATDLPSEIGKIEQQVSEMVMCCEELRNASRLFVGIQSEDESKVLLKIASCTAKLKWLNRESHLSLESCKLAVQKHKEQVQNSQIILENYLYQREQLKEEIASCQSYRGLIDEISLITLEEASLSVPSEEGLDSFEYEHQVMLKRLEAEKERRQSLLNQVEELKRRKSDMESELKESRQFLENLPKEIEKIHVAANRVSTFFFDYGFAGRFFNFLCEDSLKRMFLLPFPLYVLARQAYAFQHTFQSEQHLHFRMDIVGDTVAAESICDAFSTRWKEHENLYQMHPLQVQLELGGQPKGALDSTLQKTVTVTFSYLLCLEIVVVSCSGNASDGNLITEQFAFLFPGDDGSHSPNPTNHYLEEGKFQFQPSKVGGARPFIWAQIICGLGFPFELNLSSSTKDAKEWLQNALNYSKHIVLGAVIKALVARNYFLQSLSTQLVSLQRLIVPVNAKEAQLPGDPRSELKSWSELIDNQEFASGPTNSSFYSLTGTRKFLLEIQSESIHLRGLVAVCPDYPLTSPYWSLKCIRGPLQDSDLRDIERELCSFTDENLEGNALGENLLSIQVKKLQACVDICQEINRPSPHDSMIERPRWDRAFRGRMRTKPFVFNPEANIFEPRIG
ncbi:THO complex subunit 5 homolog B [Galdieria sulphuraria]|nr:THO complex subunit 5 homolog B [Galdieria sulphuraria]